MRLGQRGDDVGSSGPPREAVLEVMGVRRSFGSRAALDGVDLSLRPAEIYALLGPNGAGKTTLVRAISGRLRLDGGEVRLLGGDPAADAGARCLLGLVPQELALYPELTARENLEVFGRLMALGRDEAREATRRLLEQVGLSDRAHDLVSTLSGGMKRRLNVAAGVIHRPQVLLLDEPTVGVDPAAREGIHELLRELRRDGLAILLTTHDLEQAAELADRVGMLIDGRIRAEGTPAELVRGVFGDGRELLVTLVRPATTDGARRLIERGLTSPGDARVWTGRLERHLDDLSHVTAELEQLGLELAEIRVREPGLRGVFFRYAGREIDA
ncbi:MAG TPA: ABC transporter ATP-binding protein [Candidatus Sulfomarinibacteraceae bacterium]|nr:ABC transporter ATP-binding protein [Candidatus Sulfomarinibacteraceae bacterium]